MTEKEVEDFFRDLKGLENVGATVEVEFSREWDEFFRPRLEKRYSNVEVDYSEGWVYYTIDTNSTRE